jgi:hypothetical protein
MKGESREYWISQLVEVLPKIGPSVTVRPVPETQPISGIYKPLIMVVRQQMKVKSMIREILRSKVLPNYCRN